MDTPSSSSEPEPGWRKPGDPVPIIVTNHGPDWYPETDWTDQQGFEYGDEVLARKRCGAADDHENRHGYLDLTPKQVKADIISVLGPERAREMFPLAFADLTEVLTEAQEDEILVEMVRQRLAE